MSSRAKRNVMLLIVCGAVLTAFVRWTSAQIPRSAQVPGQPVPGQPSPVLEQPTMLAGSDLGFRLVRFDGQIPVGQIVVKIKGVWQSVELSK